MRSFCVGGPYYQSRLDVRSAMTCLQLVMAAPARGWEVKGWIAEDGMLDMSRSKLMDNAIRQRADWLISIDADISIKNPESVLDALALETDPKIAIVGFPAKCGTGRWNVVGFDEKTLAEKPDKRGDVLRIGTGAIAFRLGWYVKNWDPHAAYFQTFTMRTHENRQLYSVGEDYGHCNAVRSLGGRIVADPHVKAVHHTARPGSPGAALDEEGI